MERGPRQVQGTQVLEAGNLLQREKAAHNLEALLGLAQRGPRHNLAAGRLVGAAVEQELHMLHQEDLGTLLHLVAVHRVLNWHLRRNHKLAQHTVAFFELPPKTLEDRLVPEIHCPHIVPPLPHIVLAGIDHEQIGPEGGSLVVVLP